MNSSDIIQKFQEKARKYIDSYGWTWFLIKPIADLLGNLELIEYLFVEAPDIADNFLWDYQNDEESSKFKQYFTLFENIEEVQGEIEELRQRNYNIYYVYLMTIFEKHLNFIISQLGKLSHIPKAPIKKSLPKGKIEYFFDEKGDWCIKKGYYVKEIESSSIKTKLWFFHNFLGCKKPKPRLLIDKTDFEYYSEIRNRILHSNEEMVELHILPRYDDVREEIFTKNNKVLISKRFFFQAVENLFEINHEITRKMVEKYPLPKSNPGYNK